MLKLFLLLQATCRGMNGCDHQALQQEMLSTANAMMVSYWDSFRQQGAVVNTPAELAPAVQVWSCSPATPFPLMLSALRICHYELASA